MAVRTQQQLLDKSVGPIRRAWRYSHYDWTREMPRSKRVVTWVGILLQGYAFYALWTRSLAWPFMWPRSISLFKCVAALRCRLPADERDADFGICPQDPT